MRLYDNSMLKFWVWAGSRLEILSKSLTWCQIKGVAPYIELHASQCQKSGVFTAGLIKNHISTIILAFCI